MGGDGSGGGRGDGGSGVGCTGGDEDGRSVGARGMAADPDDADGGEVCASFTRSANAGEGALTSGGELAASEGESVRTGVVKTSKYVACRCASGAPPACWS